jgi:uncharacterized protein (UPF0333 family)
MRPALTRILRSRAAQSTLEYMLLVSVMVVAMWGAAQYLVPGLQQGLGRMSGDVQGMSSDGYVGGGR